MIPYVLLLIALNILTSSSGAPTENDFGNAIQPNNFPEDSKTVVRSENEQYQIPDVQSEAEQKNVEKRNLGDAGNGKKYIFMNVEDKQVQTAKITTIKEWEIHPNGAGGSEEKLPEEATFTTSTTNTPTVDPRPVLATTTKGTHIQVVYVPLDGQFENVNVSIEGGQCPSLNDFVNGAKTSWDQLNEASGFIEALQVISGTASKTAQSAGGCLKQMFIRVGDYFSNRSTRSNDASEVAASVDPTTEASNQNGNSNADISAIIVVDEHSEAEYHSESSDISKRKVDAADKMQRHGKSTSTPIHINS